MQDMNKVCELISELNGLIKQLNNQGGQLPKFPYPTANDPQQIRSAIEQLLNGVDAILKQKEENPTVRDLELLMKLQRLLLKVGELCDSLPESVNAGLESGGGCTNE